ncbi:MAG: hypothetical protein AB1546_13725 [bacterium]
MIDTPPDNRNVNACPIILLSVLFYAVHVVESARVMFLPPDAPLFNDFSLLQYTAEAARAFFAGSGALCGYDPHFMAGYPLSFIWNSNAAVQVIAVLMPSVPVYWILRLVLFGCLMLSPVLMFFSFRNFGFSPKRTFAAMILYLLYFRLGILILFHLTGMVTAGFSATLNVFVISLLYSYLRHRRINTLAAFLLFFSIAPLVHKTAVVVLFVPFIVLILLYARSLRLRDIAGGAIAIALLLAANMFWLRPFFRFLPYKITLEEAPFWQNYDLLLPLRDYFTPLVRMNNLVFDGAFGIVHTVLILFLLVAGIYGLFLFRNKQRDLMLTVAVAAAAIFLLSYYGSFWKFTAQLNPTRYIATFHLFLMIPAAAGTAEMIKLMCYRYKSGRGALFTPISVFLIALFVFSVHWLNPFYHALSVKPGGDVQHLIEWLRHNAQEEGRILLEDSGVMDREGGGQQYGKMHLPALFPKYTGKEFIGGPYPYVFLRHHFADFHDAKLFGRDVDDFEIDELRKYLNVYAVRWVIIWSERSKKYFDYYEKVFSPLTETGRFRIYEIQGGNHNTIIKGQGRAAAGYSRITVSNARPQNGEIILSYHWIDGIRSKPELKIEREKILDDPIGFIKIKNPPQNFILLF